MAEGRRVSQEVSYDVYVKVGVDRLGRDEFGEAVAHFVDREGAVALKRQLEAQGETVRVEKGFVYGLSEAEKERWFSDYSRVPEFELSRDQDPRERGPAGSQSAAEKPQRESRPATRGAQDGAARPWWRRVFGG